MVLVLIRQESQLPVSTSFSIIIDIKYCRKCIVFQDDITFRRLQKCKSLLLSQAEKQMLYCLKNRSYLHASWRDVGVSFSHWHCLYYWRWYNQVPLLNLLIQGQEWFKLGLRKTIQIYSSQIGKISPCAEAEERSRKYDVIMVEVQVVVAMLEMTGNLYQISICVPRLKYWV